MSTVYRVFVYGTLRPGGYYYQRICTKYPHRYRPAWTRGALFHLPLGYPALALGDQVVHGDLLLFDSPELMHELDCLEGYRETRRPELNEYQRVTIPAWDPGGESLGEVFGYRMLAAKIRALGGVLVPDGNWLPDTRKSTGIQSAD